jgi:hypothetical protein
MCCEMEIFSNCHPYNPEIWTKLIMSFNSLFALLQIINILSIINLFFNDSSNKLRKNIIKSFLGLIFVGLLFFPFDLFTLIEVIYLINKINLFIVYIFINQRSPMISCVLIVISIISMIASIFGA